VLEGEAIEPSVVAHREALVAVIEPGVEPAARVEVVVLDVLAHMLLDREARNRDRLGDIGKETDAEFLRHDREHWLARLRFVDACGEEAGAPGVIP